MEDHTDSLPRIDESADFAETIVLTDSAIMETREMRQLLYPDASDTDDKDDGG